jgi:hypothetical protein
MLLGSGASVTAEMPTRGCDHRIGVLRREVLKIGADFRVVDELPPNHEVFTEGVRARPVLKSAPACRDLKDDLLRPVLVAAALLRAHPALVTAPWICDLSSR